MTPLSGAEGIAIAAILLLAAFLRFWHLERNGFGNVYYAAAAWSGLVSWRNAFFAAYDPAGFVSVDKPPVALWIQICSVRAFGFSGLALHLPQAFAGTLAVFVLWRLTRRGFGPVGGIAAALALAITPISVAVDRSNLPDSWLVLTLLVAAGAFLRASATGKIAPLLVGAALMGVAFHIKMLAAFAPLPAFLLLYLLGAPRPWDVRLGHLCAALAVLVVVSASWAVLVDATPPQARPYVGGSRDNTVRDLIFGYNGAGRVIGGAGQFGTGGINPPPNAPLGLVGGGPAGIERLFRPASAPQILWFFPLAVGGLIFGAARTRWRLPLEDTGKAILLWGGWACLCFGLLSASLGTYHPYYLSLLAPALAALVGAAVGEMRLNEMRLSITSFMLLTLAALLSSIYQGILVSSLGGRAWAVIALIIVGALTLVSAGISDLLIRGLYKTEERLAASRYFVGTATLFCAPLLWCVGAIEQRGSGLFPAARPPAFLAPPVKPNPNTWIEPDERSDPRLEKYLLSHRGKARFLAATPSVRYASPLILHTGQPVMALGGFLGVDPILTEAQFQEKIRIGELRFVLDTNEGTLPGGERNAALFAHARDACRRIPPSEWRSDDSPFAGGELYDCGH